MTIGYHSRGGSPPARRMRRRLARLGAMGIGAAVALGAAGQAAAAPALSTTQVSGTLTANDLAQTLVGAGVTINSVTLTGENRTAGTFQSGDGPTPDTSIIGFSSGVVLASGSIVPHDGNDGIVVGPNNSGGQTDQVGTDGDAGLGALSGGVTFDATVLEIKFVPTQDTVSFQYVFGSEEYNEYVGSQYNDVFAFFVNGTNCATIGDPASPVAINTVNNGSNASFFRDNTDASVNTQLDGLTTVLNCVASVTPNAENTLRMAIADTSDRALDSAVFLKAGSFVAGPVNADPQVSVSAASGSEGSPINLSATADDPDTDPLTYTWSATPGPGVDPGASCTFSAPNALATSVTCTDDGTYTLTLTATDDQGASASGSAQLTVTNVAPTVQITSPANGATVAVGSPVNLAATLGDAGANDNPDCTVDWGDGSPTTSCATAHTFTAPGTYTVTATANDGDQGQATDSITITVEGDPELKPLTIGKTASAAYTRLWAWDVDKSVADPVGYDRDAKAVDVDYVVDVTRRAQGVADVRVAGVITVTNPNTQAVPVEVTDTMTGATCTLKSPAQIDAGATVKVPYTCALGGLPKGTVTNTARVEWGSESATTTVAVPFDKAAVTHRHDRARVVDRLTGSTPEVLDASLAGSRRFTYRRQLTVPAAGCATYENVAEVTPLDDAKKKAHSVSDSVGIEVCAPPAPAAPGTGGSTPAPAPQPALPTVAVTDQAGSAGADSRPATVLPTPLPEATATATATGRLGVSLAPRKGSLRSGAITAWTLTARNTGTARLDGVTVKVALPTQLKRVTKTGLRGGVVKLNLGSIAPGASRVVTIRTRAAFRGKGTTSTACVRVTATSAPLGTPTTVKRCVAVKRAVR